MQIKFFSFKFGIITNSLNIKLNILSIYIIFYFIGPYYDGHMENHPTLYEK